ncbi:amidase AmiD (plasmid) [Aminobacter sp. Y103A]|uniref:amidase n=1 Tax=Aminobacter sp. Y103A TaxID=1870862 RepID=UPI0025730D93|nr:amidase [Aminobacter sp. SS-2016]BBD41492.1 amidase AmiD [Aminobacter sp. SS-2016]
MEFLTIGELSLRLRQGERTAVDLCAQAIEAATRSETRAFSDIIAASALAEAAASDARRRKGENLGFLDGIPIAVKDLIDTTPATCKAGLQHLSSYRPTRDAVAVERLRRAGAVIIGVTETDPGAFSTVTPQVTNPLSPTRIAGGSSGGSAAAIAAGIVPAAIGTDTGGSIRIPAACCSIYGFKPTWGRVDDTGVRPLARSLDHVGPMALNVADLRIVQSVLEGAEPPTRPASADPHLRIGTSYAYFADADTVVQRAMNRVFETLAEAGMMLETSSIPLPDDILDFHMVNLSKEAAYYHDTVFRNEWRHYPQIARATVARGRKVSADEIVRAEYLRRKRRADVDAALAGINALILPTMPIDAPLRAVGSIELGGRMVTTLEATIRYTAMFNQTGHPVVSMPATLLPDGRALSIQVVGRRGEDDALLSLALYIEKILALDVDYAAIIATHGTLAYAAGRATS